MRKRFISLFAIVLCLCSVSGCSSLYSYLLSLHNNEQKLVQSVTLNYNNANVKIGQSFQLNATTINFTDDINWYSSNESLATVSQTGLVSFVDSEDNANKTVVIYAKAKSNENLVASCTFSIKANSQVETKDKYTIMYYMCASTLEYDPDLNNPYSRASSDQPYLFTEDIKEILSVRNIPDTVNILIETGGAKKWKAELGISSTKLQRWEVKNGNLNLIETLETNNMADEGSFEDFLDWGLTNYDAEQFGVVISGHGGGIAGCAYDSNYLYDYTYTYHGKQYTEQYENCLDTKEVATAAKNVLAKHGREKFTWIGYDCCLMQCADIASINSDYFEYMVASQEEEDGYGWDHDSYLPYLVNNTSISPEEFLPKITSTFVNGLESICGTSSYDYDYCYSTLSVLNLKKMSNLTSAINDYVSNVGISLTSYTHFENAFENSFNVFGDKCYGLCDLESFLSKLTIEFSNVSTEKISQALSEVVIANNYCQKYTIKPCGLNAFFPLSLSRDDALQPGKEDYTGNLATKFTSYQTMCLNFGEWDW